MNKYFKFQSDSDLGVGVQYIEFSEKGWAIRQAECYRNRWFNSCNRKYHPELGGLSLFDQQLTEAGIKLGEIIDEKEFELMWELSNTKLVISNL